MNFTVDKYQALLLWWNVRMPDKEFYVWFCM